MSALNDNIAKLDGYLGRFRETGILNRIAGQGSIKAKFCGGAHFKRRRK